MHRRGARLAFAATTVAVWLCAAVASASTRPATLMTYITGLAGPSPPYVWVALTDGGSAFKLGPAWSALISPDGTQVAAVSIDKSQTGKPSTLSLYPTPTGSGLPVQVTKNVQVMQLLGWSADSKLILITVGAQLDVVDAASQQLHTIATGSIYGASFAPGKGDEHIVYARSAPNKTAVNLYVTAATGRSTRAITHDGLSELPLWGAHGIVYSHETARPKNPYPSLQLWLVKPDGSGARQLTSLQVPSTLEGLTPVGFSANGKHLLANFVGPTGSNHTEAYTVDLGGRRPVIHDLTGQNDGNIGDGISSDGRTILVTKGTTADFASLSIETIPWSGGKPTTVISQGAYASWDR
jgi:hypothetical protein